MKHYLLQKCPLWAGFQVHSHPKKDAIGPIEGSPMLANPGAPLEQARVSGPSGVIPGSNSQTHPPVICFDSRINCSWDDCECQGPGRDSLPTRITKGLSRAPGSGGAPRSYCLVRGRWVKTLIKVSETLQGQIYIFQVYFILFFGHFPNTDDI